MFAEHSSLPLYSQYKEDRCTGSPLKDSNVCDRGDISGDRRNAVLIEIYATPFSCQRFFLDG